MAQTSLRPRPATDDGDARPHSAGSLSATLLCGGPSLTALLVSHPEVRLSAWSLACGGLVSLAGAALAHGTRWCRTMALGGLASGLWAAKPILLQAPDFTLLFFVIGTAVLNALWLTPARRGRQKWSTVLTSPGAIWSGAATGVCGWLALAIMESQYPTGTLVAAGLALGLPTLLLAQWATRAIRARAYPGLLALGSLLLSLLAASILQGGPVWTLSTWTLGLALAVSFVHAREESSSMWGVLLERPARLVVASFAVLCAVGALLLALPAASRNGRSIGLMDGAFTAVSAACVTGLNVRDTPTTFTGFGQGVLLLLIQVGGLGIMTFYTVALSALGRRLGLKHELAVGDATLVREQSTLYSSLNAVLLVTVVAELCGAALLMLCFLLEGQPWGAAAWSGLFTAVSAFCNAGFALDSQNLIPYQTQPVVLGTVALLIVLGGLAPTVVLASPPWVRRRAAVPLQVHLAWGMSALLLFTGFVGYLAFEWSVSLAGLPWWHKITNAAFQSVTTRTAGFNSVDISITTPAAQLLMIALMFVGGSPGGTAGGIKTTTAALLLLAVATALRGKPDVTLLNWRVVHRSVYRAAATATVGVLCAVGFLLAVLLTQPLRPEMAAFEVISALGTVGLSTGGTALLDSVGKVLIMAAMFTGRVGPLTLFLLLGESTRSVRWQYPHAEVDVG